MLARFHNSRDLGEWFLSEHVQRQRLIDLKQQSLVSPRIDLVFLSGSSSHKSQIFQSRGAVLPHWNRCRTPSKSHFLKKRELQGFSYNIIISIHAFMMYVLCYFGPRCRQREPRQLQLLNGQLPFQLLVQSNQLPIHCQVVAAFVVEHIFQYSNATERKNSFHLK
jgi:hypothetical protein